MAKKSELEVNYVNLIRLETDTVMLNVIVSRTVASWLGDYVVEKHENYICLVSDRIWVDTRNRVVQETELCYRLWEILVAKLAEEKLDRFIATL